MLITSGILSAQGCVKKHIKYVPSLALNPNYLKVDVYISELLYRYDCVIVPEFGGFVANYAPAYIHPVQHTFYPPSKNLTFNRNLRNNDGLLAHYVASKEKLSFAEATKAIARFVEVMNKELKRGKRYELASLGVLFLDVEGNIQFNPDKSVNFLLDSFGLHEFQSLAIRRNDTEIRVKKVFTDRSSIPQERKAGRVRKALVPSAIGVAALLAVMWVVRADWSHMNYAAMNPFSNKEKAIYQERVSQSREIDAGLDAQTVYNYFDTTSNNVVGWLNLPLAGPIPFNTEIAVPESTKVAAPEVVLSVKRYHVVTGCFSQIDNAYKLISEMKSGAVIGKNKFGLHIVSAGDYDSEAEAKVALDRIRGIYPSAWLLIK